MFLLGGWLIFCSAFLKNEIPILWGLVRFDGLSQDNISLADNKEANILFIYPKQDEKNFTEDEFESVENFSNIKRLGITIPLLS